MLILIYLHFVSCGEFPPFITILTWLEMTILGICKVTEFLHKPNSVWFKFLTVGKFTIRVYTSVAQRLKMNFLKSLCKWYYFKVDTLVGLFPNFYWTIGFSFRVIDDRGASCVNDLRTLHAPLNSYSPPFLLWKERKLIHITKLHHQYK